MRAKLPVEIDSERLQEFPGESLQSGVSDLIVNSAVTDREHEMLYPAAEESEGTIIGTAIKQEETSEVITPPVTNQLEKMKEDEAVQKPARGRHLGMKRLQQYRH